MIIKIKKNKNTESWLKHPFLDDTFANPPD